MPDSVFLLSVVTIASGIIGLCIRYLFKCKCNEFSLCCGLINVHRDIESEKEIANLELSHGVAEEDEQQQRDPEDTTGI
jgi:hypothetical protein